MKLNLPNRLTLLRIVLIPFFVFFVIYPIFGTEQITWSRIIAAAIFILAAITDFFDGKIARKRGIVTRFGKFMDPLADKFMIFGAFLAMCYSDFVFDFGAESIISQSLMKNIFFWAAFIVIFRELSITSMRLVISNDAGVVVAANTLAKIKTVTQFISVIAILLEPIAFPSGGFVSLILIVVMCIFTVWSGINYIKINWQYLNTSK